ncbi:MAG: carbohydrate ABC transporter permease [Lachnospirales bacterium]
MLYKDNKILAVFLLPTVLLILIFLYYPFLANIKNSFFDMTSFIDANSDFIGLENYKTLLVDKAFRNALFNTFKLMVFVVIFQVGIALLLAVFVSNIKKGASFFRIVYFFPIVISATAIGLMFTLFYEYNYGMLNQLLISIGKEPVVWLSKENAFTMLMIPVIWQYVGFYFVLILTGISGIPKDIYEASAIDGADGFKNFIYITLPLLKGTINVCIILALTGALKVFDMLWVIAPKGAPGGSTHVLGTYLYSQTFDSGNIDFGATIAVFLVLFGIIISQISNFIFREKD